MGDIAKERVKEIIIKGADLATEGGYAAVPNFILQHKKLSDGAVRVVALLIKYAWQDPYCFPGQERLATDMGTSTRTIRRHVKDAQENGILTIKQRGLGKTNIYELDFRK